ncbi:MAG: hypothetical protein U9Q80_05965 [Bacillota bacterium]|nr:hypothetical protein [Bacillota bacterium]
MLSDRKTQKIFLIITGILFISFPLIDLYASVDETPSMVMYVISVIVGISYIIYGFMHKSKK